MSEKTKEVKKIQDTMYTLSLHGETIYKYKYEHRLRRQVWAPLWFSPTLPLKATHCTELSFLYTRVCQKTCYFIETLALLDYPEELRFLCDNVFL